VRRLKWLRRVTAAVIVVSLSAALGFALKRGTWGDPTKGAHSHGDTADLEGVPSKVESAHDDELGLEHEDEAESGHDHEERRH
jgi:hypothetical protein